jgi:hypothetical protein
MISITTFEYLMTETRDVRMRNRKPHDLKRRVKVSFVSKPDADDPVRYVSALFNSDVSIDYHATSNQIKTHGKFAPRDGSDDLIITASKYGMCSKSCDWCFPKPLRLRQKNRIRIEDY